MQSPHAITPENQRRALQLLEVPADAIGGLRKVALARPITPAPFFCLARATWIPYALAWDPESAQFRAVEGSRGFASDRAAVEASRFLVGAAARLGVR
jgi:hypothetical protein